MNRYIKTFENFSDEKTFDLYHGCSEYSAEHFIKHGWKPRDKDLFGSNMGRGDLLYLSSIKEDALWFAEEKGESTVIKVKNIPISYLIFDPEDGDADLYDYKIENTINDINKRFIPVKLALIKSLSKEHFEKIKLNDGWLPDDYYSEESIKRQDDYMKASSEIHQRIKDNLSKIIILLRNIKTNEIEKHNLQNVIDLVNTRGMKDILDDIEKGESKEVTHGIPLYWTDYTEKNWLDGWIEEDVEGDEYSLLDSDSKPLNKIRKYITKHSPENIRYSK